MKARREKFTLSAHGRLHLAVIAVYSLSHMSMAYANGITPAQGPGGTPQMDSRNGVPIVNIVAPNAQGLSHNQFKEYNVGGKGVVLNNTQQAVLSQILKQTVGANPQLNGAAASVILNEVIGKNPSAINGAQEILGKAANYILAN
ncbi:filamentous hemagglutinin N-terminal domain-containing protein, partial [Ralstonia pseudosolanacearum]|uniref:two-partner secretion domain-containing protein n=1 Tax=Ralstonia pseudosolanacearum TaxID=1310165 RepID=UPI003D266254